jgi:MFS superfamily sulfate permease-like transporter
MIPSAVLAGVLVYFGGKLIKLKAFRDFYKTSRSEGLLFLATVLGIVLTDLLTGVILGIALSLLRLVIGVSHLDIHIRKSNGKIQIHLSGVASFLGLPRLDTQLETVDPKSDIILDTHQLRSVDQACLDLLTHWQRSVKDAGGKLDIVGPSLESLQLKLARSASSNYTATAKSA